MRVRTAAAWGDAKALGVSVCEMSTRPAMSPGRPEGWYV